MLFGIKYHETHYYHSVGFISKFQILCLIFLYALIWAYPFMEYVKDLKALILRDACNNQHHVSKYRSELISEIITSSLSHTIEMMMAGQIRNRPWINKAPTRFPFQSREHWMSCILLFWILFYNLSSKILFWYTVYNLKSWWGCSQFFDRKNPKMIGYYFIHYIGCIYLN